MLDDPAEEAAALAIADMLRDARAQLAGVVAEYKGEIAELRVQNAELRAAIVEQRAALNEKVDAKLATVRDGESVTLADVQPVIDEALSRAVKALPAPEKGDPGKSVDEAAVDAMVAEKVAKAVAGLPLQKGEDADPEVIRAMVDEAVKDLSPPEPGKGVDPVEVERLVDEKVSAAMTALPPAPSVDDVERLVAKAVTALPEPEPGKPGASVTKDDVAPMIAAEVARAVKDLPPPKDGTGLAGAVIDRDGNLVVTLTNGAAVQLGPVVGRSVDVAEVKEMVRAEVTAIPKPENGKDGFGFDDMDVVDEPKSIVLRFTKGGNTKEFRLAKPTLADAYRGVWTAGEYAKGDVVTLGGSLWMATADTTDRPESGDAWKLCVKKGRDGADLRPPSAPTPTKVRA